VIQYGGTGNVYSIHLDTGRLLKDWYIMEGCGKGVLQTNQGVWRAS